MIRKTPHEYCEMRPVEDVLRFRHWNRSSRTYGCCIVSESQIDRGPPISMLGKKKSREIERDRYICSFASESVWQIVPKCFHKKMLLPDLGTFGGMNLRQCAWLFNLYTLSTFVFSMAFSFHNDGSKRSPVTWPFVWKSTNILRIIIF